MSATSLRTRIAALFAGLGALALVTLALVIGQRVADVEVVDQGAELQSLVRAVAYSMSDGLYERQREIELLASTRGPDATALSPARWQVLIDSVQREERYAWLGVVDVHGKVHAASAGMLAGKSVQSRPWFQQGLHGPFVGDVHPAKLLAALLPPRPEDDPLRLIDFAAPLRDEQGRVIGVVGAHGDWAWARDVIHKVRSEASRARGLQVFILARDGQVLHAPPKVAPALPSPAPLPPGQLVWSRWSDGKDYMTVAMPLPARTPVTDLGWTIVARVSTASVMAAAGHARDVVLWSAVVIALGLAVVSWATLATVTRPLEAIARAARRIEAGDLEARLPQPQGAHEIRQLTDSIAGMTRRLIDGRALLEQRIAERTAELKLANEALQRAATHDALTGLPNRRAADQRLTEELARHGRNGQPLTLCLVDVDHFKRVNDQHGHAVGDQVLQQVGERLREACRHTDFVARFGGEEFLVLLPDTDAGGAEVAARKLLARVSASPCGAAGTITISVGVTTVPGRCSSDTALKWADDALYEAKRQGRNRAVHADQATETAEGFSASTM